jgi:hypothetical protein
LPRFSLAFYSTHTLGLQRSLPPGILPPLQDKTQSSAGSKSTPARDIPGKSETGTTERLGLVGPDRLIYRDYACFQGSVEVFSLSFDGLK